MSGIIAQNSGRHTGLVKASSGGGGVWNLILTQTASASATISFTSGIDSTYDEYVFTFNNIHPATDGVNFQFQGSTNTGSTYGVTMTSTSFQAFNNESGASDNSLSYRTGADIAQGTGYPDLTQESSSDSDHGVCATLQIYNPSSTTFVKHWMCRFSSVMNINYANDLISGGYFNTTSAIDAVQFKFSSGNIDAGQISLYGIS
jgi:hypothetical protein